MKKRIESYEDLEVYQKLCDLHIEVCELTFKFPKFELYELGSQLRRSSNSAPANVAEGWNNKHINIYLEGINRALGELRETKHHLTMAYRKKYFNEEKYRNLIDRYDECGRMLKSLEKSLVSWKSKPNTYDLQPYKTMKILAQNYRTGEVQLVKVPVPALKKGFVLVKNVSSLLSVGTEKYILEMAKKSLIGKAIARPDLVKN